jgi:EAL domain-containing protein (putative c-di-GMP-specific phosphodiesterase class I)
VLGTAAGVAGADFVLISQVPGTVARVLTPLSTGVAVALALFFYIRTRRTAGTSAPADAGPPDPAIDELVGGQVVLWLQRRLGGELREAVERALPSLLTRVRDQLGPAPSRAGGRTDAFAADRSIEALQRKLGGEVRTAVRQALADDPRRGEPFGSLSVPMTIQVGDGRPSAELLPATRGQNEPVEDAPTPRVSAADAGTEASEASDDLTDYRMRIHLQPISDAGGALVAVDTLLRWEHPERGLVMPVELLPRFAQEGRLQSLFSSQLLTTGRIWKQLERVAPGLHLVVRADLTASADDDRLKCLRMALALGGIDASRLHWDVSARQALAMPAQFRVWSHLCHQHGFPVLVSGWPPDAPLGLALRMPVDGVRIDARNGGVHRLRPDDIARAREAGLQVTITGLDDEAAVERARAADVDLLLGHGLGVPVLAGEFLDRLAAPQPAREKEYDHAAA